jgi:hypothetical protein
MGLENIDLRHLDIAFHQVQTLNLADSQAKGNAGLTNMSNLRHLEWHFAKSKQLDPAVNQV